MLIVDGYPIALFFHLSPIMASINHSFVQNYAGKRVNSIFNAFIIYIFIYSYLTNEWIDGYLKNVLESIFCHYFFFRIEIFLDEWSNTEVASKFMTF